MSKTHFIPVKSLSELKTTLNKHSSVPGNYVRILALWESIEDLEKAGMKKVSKGQMVKVKSGGGDYMTVPFRGITVVGEFQGREVLEIPTELETLLRMRNRPFAVVEVFKFKAAK